jgi:hypothetical protein
MSRVEFDPCSAESVLSWLAVAHQPHTRGLDAMLAAGLPIAAAGLIYTGGITTSKRCPDIIRMCQERVDAGADPAPVGIALSLLFMPGVLALTPVASPLRKWYYPLTEEDSECAIRLRGSACHEAAAAVDRGSGSVQPVGGDKPAWIVYCMADVFTDSDFPCTKFAERVMVGLERGDLDPEIALAAVLQVINLFEDGRGMDLPAIAETIAAGFARDLGSGRRLELPPVIV